MSTIKTWQERYAAIRSPIFKDEPVDDSAGIIAVPHMLAEIADLRAALAKQAEAAPVGAIAVTVLPHADTVCARLDKGSCGCTAYCAGYFNRQGQAQAPDWRLIAEGHALEAARLQTELDAALAQRAGSGEAIALQDLWAELEKLREISSQGDKANERLGKIGDIQKLVRVMIGNAKAGAQ